MVSVMAPPCRVNHRLVVREETYVYCNSSCGGRRPWSRQREAPHVSSPTTVEAAVVTEQHSRVLAIGIRRCRDLNEVHFVFMLL